MQLSDYVKARSSSKARADFYNGAVKAGFLNNVTVPDVTAIVNHQKEIFLTLAGIDNFNDPKIRELNNDLMGRTSGALSTQDFNEKITKIEKYVDALNQGSAEEILRKMSEIEPHVTSMNQLINEFQAFFMNLQNYKSMKEVQYALGPIYNRLNYLNGIAQQYSDGQLGPMPQGSLCKKIAWCEYAIKGQYLEAAGKEFFAEKLPQNIVLETGRLRGYYNIMGQFKSSGQMKEDLMILDSDNFKVTFTIGKDPKKHTLTIKKFLEFMENRKSKKAIRFTEEGYQALQAHLITAVQAKATRSNNIKFGNVNINSGQGGIEEEALLTLKEIYQEQINASEGKRGYSILQNQHKDYDLLFNYNLAHYINHIVGKNNKLLLTRNGLVDTYSFIMEQFQKGRHFYGVQPFKLSSNAGIPVALQFQE